MCDGIHIVYFCRNERDRENVEVLYLTEREKKERKKKTKQKTNKTQFMQSLLYILQNTGLQIKKNISRKGVYTVESFICGCYIIFIATDTRIHGSQ